jgi:hypothetical protein
MCKEDRRAISAGTHPFGSPAGELVIIARRWP